MAPTRTMKKNTQTLWKQKSKKITNKPLSNKPILSPPNKVWIAGSLVTAASNLSQQAISTTIALTVTTLASVRSVTKTTKLIYILSVRVKFPKLKRLPPTQQT